MLWKRKDGNLFNMEVKQNLINIAVEESKKGDHKQKIGCIVFDKKRILSKGYNSSQKSVKKLHPRFQRWPGSVHAEVDAIIKAKKDLKGSSLLVIRINNHGQFRLSKPCKTCLKYIEHVGIKKIFYSISSFPYIVELIE
jgi:deoxycytidylate deaminase